MQDLKDIQQAVTQLSPEDLRRFREWFETLDASLWDRQFEADAKTGKLDAIASHAIADFKSGKYREL